MKAHLLLGLVILGALTLPIQSWHIPHVLTALGVVATVATRFAKSWRWHHWGTLIGAVALAGISTWLKYGGPDFQIGDTPILGLILLVLRAMYQTPPKTPA
jgi:hypothetical protein